MNAVGNLDFSFPLTKTIDFGLCGWDYELIFIIWVSSLASNSHRIFTCFRLGDLNLNLHLPKLLGSGTTYNIIIVYLINAAGHPFNAKIQSTLARQQEESRSASGAKILEMSRVKIQVDLVGWLVG